MAGAIVPGSDRTAALGSYPKAHVLAEHEAGLGIQCRNGTEDDEVDGEKNPLKGHPDPFQFAVLGRPRRQEVYAQDSGCDQSEHGQVHRVSGDAGQMERKYRRREP